MPTDKPIMQTASTTLNLEKDRFELFVNGKLFAWFDKDMALNAVARESGLAELNRNGYSWVIEAVEGMYGR